MGIIRYDGTRFITEEEIDSEFMWQWVLIRTDGKPNAHAGYLVASALGTNDLRSPLEDIGIDEFNCQAKIIYGCESRGGNLHVELLG